MEEVIKKPKTQPLRLKREFEIYRLWWYLPSILKGQSLESLLKFGVTDAEIQDLLTIKTQTEFATKYGIKDLNTLSDWNKKLEKDRTLDDMFAWARKLTPNVLIGLYKAAVNEGKSAEVRAWMELVEKVQPGLSLMVSGTDTKLDKLTEIINKTSE